MPKVESSIVINSELDKVFALAKDIESFPQFMDDVKSLTVVERSADGNRTVSEWVGIIKDFKMTMKWTEEDIWDEVAKTCTFKLIKGDMKTYSGLWTFEPVDGCTKFSSVIEYEYDVPLIGAMIKALIAKIMKQNVDNLLQAIKERAEKS